MTGIRGVNVSHQGPVEGHACDRLNSKQHAVGDWRVSVS